MLSINIITRAASGKNRRVCTKRCNPLDSGAVKTATTSRFDAQGRCMNKKKTQRDPEAVSFAQARDEMFSHILRCGVIDALPEHQKDWFDDTMLYLADRYDDLTEEELTQLRLLGERFSQPVQRKVETVETGAA
jgi:hypothetical protein